MDSRRENVVIPFGLTKHELRVLKTVFLISRNRAQTYVLGDIATSNRADLVIVDSDDSAAMAGWQEIKARIPIAPVIMIARTPLSNSSAYHMGRPLLATRLLGLLDQAASEHAAFAARQGQGGELTTPDGRAVDLREASKTTRRGCRALVVDDSLPVRTQMERALTPLVEKIDLAESGEEALAYLSAKPYDIVFLDVVLPGVDGYQICKRIKQDKGTREMPVIMLTGKSSPFDRVKGKLAGCDSYLTKPVDVASFEKVVRKYLKRSEDEHAGWRRGTVPDPA
jgi:two-component system cell cycle response regulator